MELKVRVGVKVRARVGVTVRVGVKVRVWVRLGTGLELTGTERSPADRSIMPLLVEHRLVGTFPSPARDLVLQRLRDRLQLSAQLLATQVAVGCARVPCDGMPI